MPAPSISIALLGIGAALVAFFLMPNGTPLAAAILVAGPWNQLIRAQRHHPLQPYQGLAMRIYAATFVVSAVLAWLLLTPPPGISVAQANILVFAVATLSAAVPGSILVCIGVHLLYLQRIRNMGGGGGYGGPSPEPTMPPGPGPVDAVDAWFRRLEQSRLAKMPSKVPTDA